MVDAIPHGYHSITPYLTIDGAAEAIDWYVHALGATEVMRMAMGNRIGHAEIKIGDSHVMMSDEFPDMGAHGPKARGGSPVAIMLYVPDVDGLYTRAVEAGATGERAPADQFYGDRMGIIVDPFGHRWYVATHIEDVSDQEIERRKQAMFEKPAG